MLENLRYQNMINDKFSTHAEEAISRLSNALALLSEQEFDKEKVRVLTQGILDEKHRNYVEQGLASNDKSMIMHGVVGALSHYEAEKEKEIQEKRIRSITQEN